MLPQWSMGIEFSTHCIQVDLRNTKVSIIVPIKFWHPFFLAFPRIGLLVR
jgi:hypothetical protein